MRLNVDSDRLLHGLMLAGLGVVPHRLAPDFGYAILITGVVGVVAAVVLGLLGLRGFVGASSRSGS